MKRRKPNFNIREIEAILNCLESRLELVTPDPKVPINMRLKLWSEIADQVNLVGEEDVERTAAELKKKWNDYKSRIKIKAEEVSQGNISKQTTFSKLELKALELIEKANEVKTNGCVYVHSVANAQENNDSVICKEEMNDELYSDDAEIYSIDTINERVEGSKDIPDDSNREKELNKKKIEKISKKLNLPSILKMPGLTVIQEIPSEELQENSQQSQRRNKTNTDDNHVAEMMDMLWESQKELKKELKEIKRILFRNSIQKRKRLQQETEKIQLKKMKLYLKCKKMGVDYEDFVNECL